MTAVSPYRQTLGPESMAPFTFSYTGIRVRDLDRSIDFYTRILGMHVAFRTKIRKQHGEVALLKSPRGKQRLELNWYEPGTKYATTYERGEGLDHLAFRTPKLSSAIRELKRRGIRIVDRYVGPRGGSWLYIEDPDGNWIEIMGPSNGP